MFKDVFSSIQSDTVSFYELFMDKLDDIVLAIVQIILIIIVSKILISVLNKIVKNVIFNNKISDGLDKIDKKNMVKNLSESKKNSIISLLKSIISFIVWFIAIATILEKLNLGVSVSSMLATAGVGGIAIAFGAQDLVKDVVAGGFLFMESQYEIGEFVEIAGVKGTVEAINMRNTNIRAYTGEYITVPNGSIDTVTNFSRGYNLVVLDIGIAYEEDINQAAKSILDTASEYKKDNEAVIGDPEYAGVINLGNSDVVLRVTMQVKAGQRWPIERELRQLVKTNFDKQGIEIPYPRTVIING